MLEQMELIRGLNEKNKRLLIEEEEIRRRIESLKLHLLESIPKEFEHMIREPFILKKTSVKSHHEIIKFPVFPTSLKSHILILRIFYVFISKD